MQTVELLKAARELISDPRHWTQGANARLKSNMPAHPSSPYACSWCSIGALVKVAPNWGVRDTLYPHLELAILQLHQEEVQIHSFNDMHTHAEVLAVWDKAIENANNP